MGGKCGGRGGGGWMGGGEGVVEGKSNLNSCFTLKVYPLLKIFEPVYALLSLIFMIW